jgi:hypothetical protein
MQRIAEHKDSVDTAGIHQYVGVYCARRVHLVPNRPALRDLAPGVSISLTPDNAPGNTFQADSDSISI